MNKANARKIDLEKVHFCKRSKAKYRVHITIGVLATAVLAMFGTAYSHEWLQHFATGANVVTAILWIWE